MSKPNLEQESHPMNPQRTQTLIKPSPQTSAYINEQYIQIQKKLKKIVVLAFTLLLVLIIIHAYETSFQLTKRQLYTQQQHSLNQEQGNSPQQSTPEKQGLYGNYNHPLLGQHNHPIGTLDYASLGIPIVGSYFNFTKVCLSEYGHYEQQLDQFFKPFNETDCEYAVYGDNGNQSYVLCKNVIKNSQALFNIGQDGKDSFGCSISSEFKIPNYLYECKNHSYYQQYCQENHFLTKFQRKCFGERQQKVEDYEYQLLHKEIEQKDLKEKHTILKINVNGNQWSVLRHFPLDYLDKIDQLVLVVFLPHESLRNTIYWGNIDIINALKQKFVSVYLHMNNLYRIRIAQMQRMQRKYPCAVFSVTLVNKNRIKLNTESRSYEQKVKLQKNNPNDNDMQMLD